MMWNATKRPWTTAWVSAPAVLFVLLLAPEMVAAAQASKTIKNIPPRPHLAPAGTSPRQLLDVIADAAAEQGWQIIEEAPGMATASLLRRSHKAVVTIGYDESNFWIDYKDSENLNYNPNDRMRRQTKGRVRRKRSEDIIAKGPVIHPTYNLWVAALANQISIRMQRRAEPSGTSPLLIADELDKLDKLRQRGVLTQEEFDEQKTKLLAR